MLKIQKYIQRSALTPLLLSLGALSLLALLTQSLSTIDLIVENRQSALTFLYITVLALPQLFGIIMPLAVFMAMLYALNRLNVDNELVVSKAAGITPWQIASPVLRIGMMALIAHLVINLFVQPYSFRKMRQALLDVRTDIASHMVLEGEFSEPTQGLTIYASEILPSGVMKDVLIHDKRSNDVPFTYSADEGIINSNGTLTSLTLTSGNFNFINDEGMMEITNFESYTYPLTNLLAIDPVLRLKSSDRYLHELFNPDPSTITDLRLKDKFAAEGHARLSTPLYNIALILLALAFLIRGEHRKLGYGKPIAIAAAIGFSFRLSGFALTSSAESNPDMNIVQYALPLTACVLLLWYILRQRKVKRRKTTKRMKRKAA